MTTITMDAPLFWMTGAVDDVILYTDNATYRSPSSSAKVISFVKGVPQAVGCVTRGGYPPPQVTLYLDDLEVTDQFALDQASSLEGVRGLRLMKNQVLLWTGDMVVETGDDGRLLWCHVTVPGMAPKSTSAIVAVNCESKFPFASSVVHLYSHSFVRSFVRSFIHSFIRPFIQFRYLLNSRAIP